MADWYYDVSGEQGCEELEDEPAPLELLRSTGPHAGLATLSAELWQAWASLPRPERIALAFRDEYAEMNEDALALGVALALHREDWRPLPWSEAKQAAQQALEKTRGILDAVNGKVTR